MTLSPNATAPATPVEPVPDPVDAVRPLRRTALFGLQHVLVMAATPISSVFLISGTLGLDRDLTVVVWGEFGRTPKINKDAGRDHWSRVNFALMSGGGMRTAPVPRWCCSSGSPRPTACPPRPVR